jgi:BirA family biotin operon repressor/biotin-[acetyl-CoA-carboxylase] ligase
MNPVRDAILTRLDRSRKPVSGDMLAKDLGLSRTAVWKHVQALKRQGAVITAHAGKGYVLENEMLTASILSARLGTRRIGRSFLVLDEMDSTNLEAMRQAEKGADEGLVVIAKRQTAGRGRLGRRWHTAADATLALSVLLRPKLPPERVPQLSLVAAVATHQALSAFAPGIRIKWPNDILHDGAKLAGILTEMRAEPGCVHAVVIGIGINIHTPEGGWPEDITQKVTDLHIASETGISRLETAVRLITTLDSAYATYLKKGFAPIRQHWLDAHAAAGKQVRVHDGHRYITGIAEGLDDDGALMLRTGKQTQRIITGDLEIAG